MVWRGRLKLKLLSIMLKIDFTKIKVAHFIIRDIEGYHAHLFLSSNLSIEKAMTVI
jgi:hypothetical protein